jgi:hypothetical protein
MYKFTCKECGFTKKAINTTLNTICCAKCRTSIEEKNCLPEGLNSINDKIEYVKSAYGLNGEKGNLFDWLISEIMQQQKKIESPVNSIDYECHSKQSNEMEDCNAHIKEGCNGCKFWY